MKISAIVAVLLCSAIALGKGIGNSLQGTQDESAPKIFTASATASDLSANTSIGYILSTVSADFALPGRPIAA
ncbi:MAG: hypothetical protein HGB20_03985 [Chlorobiaceae bacterium]|nr:hypothetical protein [Chlorobiaceae bacterium]